MHIYKMTQLVQDCGSIVCSCNTEVRSVMEVLYAIVILKYVL